MPVLTFLYQYLTAPKQTITSTAKQTDPIKAGLLIVFLTGLSQNIGFDTLALGNPISIIVMSMIFLLICVGFESMMIDFVAQFAGCVANSKKLFIWLTLTFMPYLGLVPFSILMNSGFFPEVLFGLLAFFTFIFSCVLQVKTLSVIYDLSTFQSFCLLLAPILVLFVIILLLVGSFSFDIPWGLMIND